MDHHLVALVIRWIHVGAMATLLGGALLLAWLAARGPHGAIVDVAARYEQVFWAGLGVVVLTGVGNLGAFGLALPAPSTTWGGTFGLKMLSVVALVALSLPRSLIVARLQRGAGAPADPMRSLYTATAGLLAAIAAMAVWLAHG